MNNEKNASSEVEMNEELYRTFMAKKDNDINTQSINVRKNKTKWFVWDLQSISRLRFDFLTCILVLFDCIMIPMKISFGLDFVGKKNKNVIEYLDYAIRCVFILDLILGFFRSYIN